MGRVVKYKATKYDVWGNYLLGSDTYNGNTVIPIDFENMPNNNNRPDYDDTMECWFGFRIMEQSLVFPGRLVLQASGQSVEFD